MAKEVRISVDDSNFIVTSDATFTANPEKYVSLGIYTTVQSASILITKDEASILAATLKAFAEK